MEFLSYFGMHHSCTLDLTCTLDLVQLDGTCTINRMAPLAALVLVESLICIEHAVIATGFVDCETSGIVRRRLFEKRLWNWCVVVRQEVERFQSSREALS